MAEHDLKLLQTELPDKKWKHLTENLAYPYEFFYSIDEYQNQLTIQRKKTSSVN